MVRIVVPTESLHHAQRVRRALQELGQHQVIEREPGSPRGVHAEISRLGVDVNAGAGQHGRWGDVGRGGAAHELRTPRVPVRGSLVGSEKFDAFVTAGMGEAPRIADYRKSAPKSFGRTAA